MEEVLQEGIKRERVRRSGRLLLLRQRRREREAGGVEFEAVGSGFSGLSWECWSVGKKGSFHEIGAKELQFWQ